MSGCPAILRAWNVNRTHAFALRKKSLIKVHQPIWHAPDYQSHAGGWHIDHQLGLAHERNDWSVYTPKWWLAGQDRDWSNISGRYNPRLWWHPSMHCKGLPFVEIPPDLTALPPELKEFLHPGNTLKPGTLEDVGLDTATSDPVKLEQWLAMIAREAVDMHCLPAWQKADITSGMVSQFWRRGVIPLNETVFPDMTDYPWNGLLTVI